MRDVTAAGRPVDAQQSSPVLGDVVNGCSKNVENDESTRGKTNNKGSRDFGRIRKSR